MSLASLDTNVLIYAVDPSEGARHTTARALLERALRQGWPIAAQVYGEFYALTTRKQMFTRTQAREVLTTWRPLMPPLPSSLDAFDLAVNLAADKQLQFWDALIVATCSLSGVKQLYTEDGFSAKRLAGVGFSNPF